MDRLKSTSANAMKSRTSQHRPQPPSATLKRLQGATKDSASNDDSSGDDDDGQQPEKRKAPQIQSMIGEYTMEELKGMHPQRNVFQFGHITISSDFDAGNLARCEEGDEDGCVR